VARLIAESPIWTAGRLVAVGGNIGADIGPSCGLDTGQSAKSEIVDLGRVCGLLVEFRQRPQVGGGTLVRAVAVLACCDGG
jgi:hypothetical protein